MSIASAVGGGLSRFSDDAFQFLGADWLGDVCIHACCQAAFTIAFHGVAR